MTRTPGHEAKSEESLLYCHRHRRCFAVACSDEVSYEEGSSGNGQLVS